MVLHVRYTAREGGELLKTAAVQSLQTAIKKAHTIGSVCLFSLCHDFPTEWAKFKNVTLGGATTTAPLSVAFPAEHYPFRARGVIERTKPVKGVQLFAEMSNKSEITGDAARKLGQCAGRKVIHREGRSFYADLAQRQ